MSITEILWYAWLNDQGVRSVKKVFGVAGAGSYAEPMGSEKPIAFGYYTSEGGANEMPFEYVRRDWRNLVKPEFVAAIEEQVKS